jgi:DNA-binding ferritin-like protein
MAKKKNEENTESPNTSPELSILNNIGKEDKDSALEAYQSALDFAKEHKDTATAAAISKIISEIKKK